MKIITIFIIHFILSLGVSRPPMIKVYHNSTLNLSDGEIWGSDLYVFFEKNDNINASKIYSYGLDKELLSIKIRLKSKEDIFGYDDYPYDYAFITSSRDTVYTNDSFSVWRYKNKRAKVTNKVNSYLPKRFH